MISEIYLDNSLTTRPSEAAVSAMMPFLTHQWGSPSAPHRKGQELFPAMEQALKQIYALFGAREQDTVIFASSGAEAVNHVLLSAYFDIAQQTGRNQFITCHTEEAPAMMAISRLEELGCVSKMVHVNAHGAITAEAIADMISPRTALVSLSWANGLTGVVNQIPEIADLCRERGIKLHLDASHVLGKLYFDLEDIRPDYVTLGGELIHAPAGTGALYMRSGSTLSPMITGGLQQAGYRGGSYSVAGLIALGEAAREAMEARDLLCVEVARLRHHLEEGILMRIPQSQIFFSDQQRVPHITAAAFPGVSNEALLYLLSRKGLYASIGGGSAQQIAYQLQSAGVPQSVAQSALSFSLSRETTEEQIEQAVDRLAETVADLRKISSQLEGIEG